MTTSDLLWIVLPYVSVAVFVVGIVYRYRYDKLGWTTRSSQLYESAVLRWGSPLFHVGILLVLAGHVGGLLVPASWTDAIGISDAMYHDASVFIGTTAGAMTVIGLGILIARRRLIGSVFTATTRNDKAMYLVLATTVLLGMAATFRNTADPYSYRETVSPWFRSLFILDPDPELMADVPLAIQLHVVAAFVLFAFWPFTRLVHAFSAPVGYLFFPYMVYRSRLHRERRAARARSRAERGGP
jgi:nitrate reductase gamma subunit